MINRCYVVSLVFFAFGFHVKAQDIQSREYSVGYEIGMIEFYGDVSQVQGNKIDNNLSVTAFSFTLNKKIDEIYTLQLEYLKGEMGAHSSFSKLCDNIYHAQDGVSVQHIMEGESFQANFIELDVNLLVNLSNLNINAYTDKTNDQRVIQNRGFNFLAKIGIGLNTFRTIRQELNSGYFINSYGYEWLWENDFDNAKEIRSHPVTEVSYVLGLIAQYKFNEITSFNLSASCRIGGQDKWDAKLSGKNDMFILYSLGVNVNLL